MSDVRSVLHVMFAHHDKFSSKRENDIRAKGSRPPASTRASEQSNNQTHTNPSYIPTVEIF